MSCLHQACRKRKTPLCCSGEHLLWACSETAKKHNTNNNNNYTATATQIDLINNDSYCARGWVQSKLILECVRLGAGGERAAADDFRCGKVYTVRRQLLTRCAWPLSDTRFFSLYFSPPRQLVSHFSCAVRLFIKLQKKWQYGWLARAPGRLAGILHCKSISMRIMIHFRV